MSLMTATNSTQAVQAPRTAPRELMMMDAQLTDIQPGGGFFIRLEQAWGRLRRLWLKTFRKSYVARMAACRKGDFNPCPHEVLDPRDLKFHTNQGGWYWDRQDDPFAWRDRLPIARVALVDVLVLSGGLLFAAAGFGWWAVQSTGLVRLFAGLLAMLAAIFGGLMMWFFRDPQRQIPAAEGLVVAPADGKILDIQQVPHDDYIGGPAIRLVISVSLFNSHINRASMAGRVIGLAYQPGKSLNALRPESARLNERLTVFMETLQPPYHGFVMQQITGGLGRRIVCWLKPGDILQRGQRYGMIKLGSRAELLLPAESTLQIRVAVGDRVQAGSSVLAVWTDDERPQPATANHLQPYSRDSATA